MAATAVRCPSCGGANSTVPDEAGTRQCEYCGTRFDIAAARAEAEKPKPPPRWLGRLVRAGLGLGLGLGLLWLAMLAFVRMTAPQPVDGERESERYDVLDPLTVEHVPLAQVYVDPPPPPPVPEAKFTFDNKTRSRYVRSFHVYGRVENTGSVPLGSAEVVVVLQDAEGHEVHQTTGRVARELIAPGEVLPISVFVYEPPDHESLAFELSTREPWPTGLEPAEGLTALDVEVDLGDDFDARARGKVVNRGEKPARFVYVELAGYDEAGKVVGVANTPADGSVLAPGATTTWDIVAMSFSEPPARYETAAWGTVAD